MANRSFPSFGEENVDEFTIATISYYSEFVIWLGKILTNDDRFAKFLRYTVCMLLSLLSILYSAHIIQFTMINYIVLDCKK